MKGSRNLVVCGLLGVTPQRRRTCPQAGETQQMAVFQQPIRIT
jgi:hypothetical protein